MAEELKTVSLRRAARILGVHYMTMYRYARRAVAGQPGKLTPSAVTQNPVSGYYQVELREVLRLGQRDR